MATANTLIRLKKSGTSGITPSALEYGELGLNYADGKLFYKKPNGTIGSFSAAATTTESFSTLNVNSTLLLATTPTDILNLTSTGGINILGDGTSKTITIDGTETFNKAQAAFSQANVANTVAYNAVMRTGDTITGDLVINSNTVSTSNGTGSLLVSGGVGVTGNVSVSGYLNLSNTAGGRSGHIFFNEKESSIDFVFF